MIYLTAALLAPVAGALLYRWLHAQPSAVRWVDGFVYAAVPALVAWQVVPHAWSERTGWPLLAVALGAAVPTLAERASHAFAHQTDNVALVGALAGLLLHATLEGAALASGEAPVSAALGGAVVLHRIPVGLVVWWLIRPRHGVGPAVAAVAALVAATFVGFVVSALLPPEAHGAGFVLFQAFVAGSLLHVVFHQGRHDHRHHAHEEPPGTVGP